MDDPVAVRDGLGLSGHETIPNVKRVGSPKDEINRLCNLSNPEEKPVVKDEVVYQNETNGTKVEKSK